MKRVHIILLIMPFYLSAQIPAPRRPLTIDSLKSQPARKTLLQLRETIKENQVNTHRDKQKTLMKQKPGHITEDQ